jgi:hypothetical protein
MNASHGDQLSLANDQGKASHGRICGGPWSTTDSPFQELLEVQDTVPSLGGQQG